MSRCKQEDLTNDLKTKTSLQREIKPASEKERGSVLLNRFHNYHVTSRYPGCNHRRQVIFQPSGVENTNMHAPSSGACRSLRTTNAHAHAHLPL